MVVVFVLSEEVVYVPAPRIEEKKEASGTINGLSEIVIKMV